MPVNYSALSIGCSVSEGLAVLLTFFRLGIRLKIRRFWWEDFWAAIASLFTVVSIACALVTTEKNYESTLIASRINAYVLTSIKWSVRMSLVSSIIRVTYPGLFRRIVLTVATCFLLFWATMLVLQVWWCMCDTTPVAQAVNDSCVVPTFVAVVEVTTNVVADVATVILSFKLLSRVKLPRRQRRMILYLFTTSRFLCLFSLAHAITQFVRDLSMQNVLAYLQVTAFMVVCNLVVVVTYLYRIFWNSPEDDLSPKSESYPEDDDFTTPFPRGTQSLTTVNLDSPLTSFTGSARDGSGSYH